MGKISSTIISYLLGALRHPSLYYLICFVIMLKLEMRYSEGIGHGDSKLLGIINIIYAISFPVISLFYIKVKPFIKFFFALIAIAVLSFISAYLKVGIDYAMGNQNYVDLMLALLSALQYTAIDIIFIVLCSKITGTNTNKKTIAIIVF